MKSQAYQLVNEINVTLIALLNMVIKNVKDGLLYITTLFLMKTPLLSRSFPNLIYYKSEEYYILTETKGPKCL